MKNGWYYQAVLDKNKYGDLSLTIKEVYPDACATGSPGYSDTITPEVFHNEYEDRDKVNTDKMRKRLIWILETMLNDVKNRPVLVVTDSLDP